MPHATCLKFPHSPCAPASSRQPPQNDSLRSTAVTRLLTGTHNGAQERIRCVHKPPRSASCLFLDTSRYFSRTVLRSAVGVGDVALYRDSGMSRSTETPEPRRINGQAQGSTSDSRRKTPLFLNGSSSRQCQQQPRVIQASCIFGWAVPVSLDRNWNLCGPASS